MVQVVDFLQSNRVESGLDLGSIKLGFRVQVGLGRSIWVFVLSRFFSQSFQIRVILGLGQFRSSLCQFRSFSCIDSFWIGRLGHFGINPRFMEPD